MSKKKSSSDPLDGDTGEGLELSSADNGLLDGDTGDGDGPEGGLGSELDGTTGGEPSNEGHPLPLAIGDTFYRFTLKGLLGRGGTGVVYTATGRRSSEEWALKILWPHLRVNPEVERHFLEGHRLATNLHQQCPGVIPIHDVGDKKGHVYVKMSPFAGCPTLSKQLQPPRDRDAFRTWLDTVFKPLCETVDSLHDNGIVHGDLKADNILISPKRPIVIDFGLAMDFRSGLRTMNPQLGTQSIMSPEQYIGQGIGPATDRYALGLMIYRYLAGRYPWDKGASNLVIRQAKETNQLRPLTTPLVDSLTGLSEVVHTMLQRDTAQRYPRCMEFYARLVECTELFRQDTSGSIREDDRIQIREYEADALSPLRQSKIREYNQRLLQREPSLVVARMRIEELQRLLQSGQGGPSDLQEIQHILNQHPIWELAPLQRLPFSLMDGSIFTMRLLPAGRFEMGSAQEDYIADGSEKPQLGVYIAEGFWMAETPVTQKVYQAVMGINPSSVVLPNHPVTQVSWIDAIQFCNRLSEALQLEPVYRIRGKRIEWNKNAGGFRLPTEAEWEYGAMAQQSFLYAGSDQSGSVAWCQHNAANTSHPVGQKHSNGFGLYDMCGNVAEWCWDWYNTYPKTTEQTLFHHSPLGPLKGDTRSVRGGSYRSSEDQVRVKSRWSEKPNEATDFIGFRVVQSIRR